MTYPGNATLTREMQERILSTFKQTLTAAAAGNRQEATLGCDFILRLDSLFGPARQLQERLEGGEGPVETADLAAAVGFEAAPPPAAPDAAAAAPQPPDIDELADLDLGLDELEAAPAATPEPTVPEVPAPAAPPPPPAQEPTAPAPAQEPLAPPPPAEPAPPAEPMAPPPAEPAPPEPMTPPPAEPAPPEPMTPPPAEPAPAPPAEVEAPASTPPPVDEFADLDLALDEATAAASEPAAPEATEEPTAEPEPPAAVAPPAEPPPAPEEPVAEDTPPLEAPDDTETAPESEISAPEPIEPASEEAAEPAAAPPPPESVEIPLDAEPAAQLDADSQQRIDDLLAEGQEAFGDGEYQGAIDAWSRIFLIDIDHAEANRRIEEARKLKAEADRKVEERFHEGLSHLESGDTDAAADSFRAVLEMQSSHLQARDYLEKLEAGEVPVPTEVPKPADGELPDADMDLADMEASEELGEAPQPKPERGSKPVGERVVTVKKSPLKSKTFLALAAAGVIAVAAGGWYLFSNWSQLFPNSAQEEPTRTAPDPVTRAKGLHEEGKTPIAIAQLRRLPPDSPQYDEAQALIAQWELEQAPASQGPEGPSPEELARREALIAAAGAAGERREFLRTSELLSEAAAVAPLSGTEVQLLAQADEQLQELQNFITLFREGEWDMGLRDLWLLHESDPGNADVTRLLVDSYYNLGLRALQRSDVKVAEGRFKEALGLSPEDPELLRLADFASTYQTRTPDLLYRIYVKYHPFR